MKRLAFIPAILLLLFSCNNENQDEQQKNTSSDSISKETSEINQSQDKEVTLFDCTEVPENSFAPLFEEIQSKNSTSTLAKDYSEQLTMVSVYFDSLQLIEESRNAEITLALNELHNVNNINIELYNDLVGKICLIKSNRPSADEFCFSKRLDVYDNLRSGIYNELDSLIRDAAIKSSDTEIDNVADLTTDDLILILENEVLADHYNGYMNWEKYEISYGTLYREALENYNKFIDENKAALKEEGFTQIKKFPRYQD